MPTVCLQAVYNQPTVVSLAVGSGIQSYKGGVYKGSCASSPNHQVLVSTLFELLWVLGLLLLQL